MASTMEFASGHRMHEFTEEEQKEWKKKYPKFPNTLCRVNPGNWLIATNYAQFANDVYNFQHEKDDVMVMSFPKSGTVWMTEIIWAMRNYDKLHTEESKVSLILRAPNYSGDFQFINEADAIRNKVKEVFGTVNWNQGGMYQSANLVPRPRTLRSHSPLSFLPPNLLDTCKTVYIIRDPRDMCVSFYHFMELVDVYKFNGDLDAFIEIFMKDECLYTPYWEYVREVLKQKNHPNLHWVYFEDLKKNTRAEIQRLNDFLGTKLSEEQIDKVVDYTSFQNMKQRDPVYGGFEENGQNAFTKSRGSENFFRKGQSGDGKKKISPEVLKKFEKWVKENTQGTVLQDRYI